MNDHLKQLMLQAGYAAPELAGRANKLAELIVRQCIGMVLPYNEEDPCAERLYELADTIGEHFGVEE